MAQKKNLVRKRRGARKSQLVAFDRVRRAHQDTFHLRSCGRSWCASCVQGQHKVVGFLPGLPILCVLHVPVRLVGVPAEHLGELQHVRLGSLPSRRALRHVL